MVPKKMVLTVMLDVDDGGVYVCVTILFFWVMRLVRIKSTFVKKFSQARRVRASTMAASNRTSNLAKRLQLTSVSRFCDLMFAPHYGEITPNIKSRIKYCERSIMWPTDWQIKNHVACEAHVWKLQDDDYTTQKTYFILLMLILVTPFPPSSPITIFRMIVMFLAFYERVSWSKHYI